MILLDTCPPTFEQQNLSLYTIDGYTATLPPNEVVVDSFSTFSEFLNIVVPTWQGQQVQLAYGNEIVIYEGRFISGSWVWTEI